MLKSVLFLVTGWEKRKNGPAMSNIAGKYSSHVYADFPPRNTFGNGLFSFHSLNSLLYCPMRFLMYIQEGRCQWPIFTISVQLLPRMIEIFKDSESGESVDLIKQASLFSSLAYKLNRMVTPRAECSRHQAGYHAFGFSFVYRLTWLFRFFSSRRWDFLGMGMPHCHQEEMRVEQSLSKSRMTMRRRCQWPSNGVTGEIRLGVAGMR
ncbi:hypothetical protein F5H01DRAFT_119736 [Linnemannia elongata]|nr:hypothetical protein F5H01DRAFT_119736 [Linnemannia elongata]